MILFVNLVGDVAVEIGPVVSDRVAADRLIQNLLMSIGQMTGIEHVEYVSDEL